MTTKHTPSPWIAENGMVYAFDEFDRVNRFSVMITGGYSSAPVYGDRVRTTPEELTANARLIAAAPDMLAALQNAAGLLDTPLGRRLFDGSDFYQDVIESIRTAITKTTTE